MKWSDFKARLPEFVIPLHDKKWTLEEFKKGIIELNDFDMNDPDDVEEYEHDIDLDSDGAIIVGKPSGDDWTIGMMFGFQNSDGWLDDTSSIEYITQRHWKELEEHNLVDLRSMESYIAVLTGNLTTNEFDDLKGDKLSKEVILFMSELIGQSLFSTNSIDVSSTADCKKFIIDAYNSKVKRVKKEKWGNLEFRLFEDEDGEQYTIVSYKDKLISHYPFSYTED